MGSPWVTGVRRAGGGGSYEHLRDGTHSGSAGPGPPSLVHIRLTPSPSQTHSIRTDGDGDLMGTKWHLIALLTNDVEHRVMSLPGT